MEAKVTAIRRAFEAEEEELKRIIGEEQARVEMIFQDRQKMAVRRHSDEKQPRLRTR